jgi:hypothetical protein
MKRENDGWVVNFYRYGLHPGGDNTSARASHDK